MSRDRTELAALLALVGGACRPGPFNVTAERPPDAKEAVVRIDSASGKKNFQGVWLEQEGSPSLVIDYRAHGCWSLFEGKRVLVTGAAYEPMGQAISAPHFRVETMQVADEHANHNVVALGPEETWQGSLKRGAGSPGSKMAASSWLELQSSAMAYRIYNPTAVEAFVGEKLELRGRSVELSRFSAHDAAHRVWVTAVKRDDEGHWRSTAPSRNR